MRGAIFCHEGRDREGKSDDHRQRPCKDGSGSKYLQQLCKHWSHKFKVDYSHTRGQVHFPSALATMEVNADALLVTVTAENEESIERLKAVIADHLNRFAFREAPLLFEWTVSDPS